MLRRVDAYMIRSPNGVEVLHDTAAVGKAPLLTGNWPEICTPVSDHVSLSISIRYLLLELSHSRQSFVISYIRDYPSAVWGIIKRATIIIQALQSIHVPPPKISFKAS